MKVLILFFLFCLISCDPIKTDDCVKDFCFKYYEIRVDRTLYLCNDETVDTYNSFGKEVVPNAIYAYGYNNNFIITKRHPDLSWEFRKRIFSKDSTGYFLLAEPSDTAYLSCKECIFRINNNWYHDGTGFSYPPNTYPNKQVTYYGIVDIRNYPSEDWNQTKSYKDRVSKYIFEYDNEEEFMKKRAELGVSPNLKFTFIDKL